MTPNASLSVFSTEKKFQIQLIELVRRSSNVLAAFSVLPPVGITLEVGFVGAGLAEPLFPCSGRVPLVSNR